MAITISQIQNADLRQMATRIDNGDGKLNHKELATLISGVSDLQNVRIEQKDILRGKIEEAREKEKTEESNIAWGGLGAVLLSGLTGALIAVNKPKMGSRIGMAGIVLSTIASIYKAFTRENYVEKVEQEKYKLEHDENLNSMASEIKNLVKQMANGKNNEDVAAYLGRHDSGVGNELIAAKTWNDYVNAVYGVLRDYPEDVDKLVSSHIPVGRAEASLDKYDDEMLEKL